MVTVRGYRLGATYWTTITATLQTRAQRTSQRKYFNGLNMMSMVRRLTESGSFAHAKYHDLQHSRPRQKVIGNRTSAKNQSDVKEPPN
jgi:hypothetical protein